jgi:ribosomal protein L11 methyltransferase
VLALVVTVRHDDVELASDSLWALGVVAIEERIMGDLVELWTSIGDDADAVQTAAATVLRSWRWRVVEVDESIADTWRDHAQPVWVEPDLVVCPAWVPFAADTDVTVLRIEPGSTFGLGDHPTTVLSLRALRAALRPGCAILDVGCGSGVLSVAACMLGATSAVAVDIAPASIDVTNANARVNGVEGRVEVSTTPLANVDGTFDVVVANILAPTLIDLADDLRRVVRPSGLLIISGVLVERHEHVEAALYPMVRTRRDVLDGWAALTLGNAT